MAKVDAPLHVMKRRSGFVMTVLKSLIYFQVTVNGMMVYVLDIAGRMDNYGVYRCIVLV